MRARRGFTLIELIIVMAVIGLLARLAVPRIGDALRRAQAARIVGDFEAIRVAAFDYNAAHDAWPADYPLGATPPELVGSLPAGFTFDRGAYQLDWENWSLPGGTAAHPETGILLGISVKVDDPRLGEAVIRLLGDGAGARYALGNTYTFIVLSVGGAL